MNDFTSGNPVTLQITTNNVKYLYIVLDLFLIIFDVLAAAGDMLCSLRFKSFCSQNAHRSTHLYENFLKDRSLDLHDWASH